MRLARYHAGGEVRIEDAPVPACPPGGLLVQTEACGLCSGELMEWYMDRKAPHVFGHEVSGRVVESQDDRFPVGCRVFPHHHAPCLNCDACHRGAHVHCPQWKRTRLDPGGMAEFFAVSAENLNDTHQVDDLRAEDAALAEPLACVLKGIRRAGMLDSTEPTAVIGAGALGIAHALLLRNPVLFEVNSARIAFGKALGLDVVDSSNPHNLENKFEAVFVCPGSASAIRLGADLCRPEGKLVLFAPMNPGESFPFTQESAYFRDLVIIHTYSCGPTDTELALNALRSSRVTAEQIVSDFVDLEDLPRAYDLMKRGELLKAMVKFV